MTQLKVTRLQQLTERLQSTDIQEQYAAVKAIKNEVIGNRSKKIAYFQAGALEKILSILNSSSDEEVQLQAATAIGSFAYGLPSQASRQLVKHRCIQRLLQIAQSENPKLVEAGMRALKMVLQSPHIEIDDVFEERALTQIAQLLQSGSEVIAEITSSCVARCCRTDQQRRLLWEAGVLQHVVQLLRTSRRSCQDAALDALAQLSWQQREVALMVLSQQAVIQTLTHRLLDPATHARALACTILTNVTSEVGPDDMQAEDPHRIQQQTLPVLVKLLAYEELWSTVPLTLARLVNCSESLQHQAHNLEAIQKLAGILQQTTGPSSAAPPEGTGGASSSPDGGGQGTQARAVLCGCMEALGKVCFHHDTCRLQLIKAGVLRQVLASFYHADAGVRRAAVSCIYSLTRSAKSMSELMDKQQPGSQALLKPVCQLMKDPDESVQEPATATVVNLVLQSPTFKSVVAKEGDLETLVQLLDPARSLHLRILAAKALARYPCLASLDQKQALVEVLKWEHVMLLLQEEDPDRELATEAMVILRNLLHGQGDDSINLTLAWGEANLTQEVVARCSRDTQPALRRQALHAANNLAVGSEDHREALMAARVQDHVMDALEHSDPQLVVACLWLIINLVYTDMNPTRSPANPKVMERQRLLAGLGVVAKLEELQSNEHQDIKERAADAFHKMKLLESGIDYQPLAYPQ